MLVTGGVMRFRTAAIAACATTAVVAVWIWLQVGGVRTTAAVDNLAELGAAMVAALACLGRTQRETAERRAWLLLSWSATAWAVGQAIWTYYETWLGRSAPFPSLADAGFLTAVPLAAVALLSFDRQHSMHAERLQTALDGVLIGLSLFFVSWAYLLGPTARQNDDAALTRGLAVAYPVGDVVLIAIVLLVLVRVRSGTRSSLLLVGAGISAIALADSTFGYLTLSRDFGMAGHPLDAGWVGGYLIIALAAMRTEEIGEPTRRNEPSLRALLPFFPIVLALAVGVQQRVAKGPPLDPVLAWVAILAAMVMFVRQVVALLSNAALSRSLAATLVDLRQRTADLEQSNADLEQFAFVASHDLSEPLRVIYGYADLLAQDVSASVDSQTRMFATEVRDAAARMNALVKGLLQYSRLGNTPLSVEPLSAGQVVADVVNDLMPRISDAGGELEVSALPVITADATQLRLVFMNLVANAFKFAVPGTIPKIRLAAERNGDGWVFSVTDNGVGIPARDREKVFKMFQRLHGRDEYEGTGIGLAVCYRIVQRHGGHIWVDGEYDGGARVCFTIPDRDDVPVTVEG